MSTLVKNHLVASSGAIPGLLIDRYSGTESKNEIMAYAHHDLVLDV
jgi:hypothetical protein